MASSRIDIDKLSAEERNQLRSELPLTEAQAEELDRRLQAYREDGDRGEPWREALSRIGKGAP